jgi:hypothetical protein
MSSIVNGHPVTPHGVTGVVQPVPGGASPQVAATEPTAGGAAPAGGGSSHDERVLAIMSGEEDGSRVWAGGEQAQGSKSAISQTPASVAAVLAPIGTV